MLLVFEDELSNDSASDINAVVKGCVSNIRGTLNDARDIQYIEVVPEIIGSL
jgi:hypothetical protein